MSIKIDQAFTDLIMKGGLALDIAHEAGNYSTWNGASYDSVKGVYKPTATRPYIELKTFPASKKSLSLKDTDDAVGLFQAIVRYPTDGGAFVAKSKAEEILTLLKVGSKITYSTQAVNIVSNNRDGGIVDGGYFEVVVRANYRAFIKK